MLFPELRVRAAYRKRLTHPISPVACIVAVRLTVEVIHDSNRPSACAHGALAKVLATRLTVSRIVSRLRWCSYPLGAAPFQANSLMRGSALCFSRFLYP